MATDFSNRKLSERSVERISTPTTGYQIVWDAGDKAVPGFGVRVTSGGVKAFVLDYRIKARNRRITIGRFGPWTALAARKRAKDLRRKIDAGDDPLFERDAARGAPLMSELFERYLTEHALRRKKLSSVAEDWGLIHGGKFHYDGKTFGKPDKPFGGVLGKFFGKMPINEVTRGDVVRFHGALYEKPYRANRALALLSKAFNLAEVWELRPLNSNPCRHVEKYDEVARTRYLKPDELTVLSGALDKADPMVAGAIKLLLFSGARVSEVLGLTWENIDTKAGTATLEDAKAGPRPVQLSTEALTVLSELGTDEGPIFGELTYDKLDKAWRRIRKDVGLEGARIHDLRHTVGTYAGQSGTNAFVVRDLLGHKTLAMTDRYVGQYADPVKVASEAVSNQIAAALRGKKAKVVDHPRKAARR